MKIHIGQNGYDKERWFENHFVFQLIKHFQKFKNIFIWTVY